MHRTKVINGTASGLGHATDARENWNEIATTRDGRNPFPGREHQRSCRWTSPTRKRSPVRHTGAEPLGSVDVLVNNAGCYQVRPLERSTVEQIRAQFEPNVFGLITATQTFLPLMRAQRSGAPTTFDPDAAGSPTTSPRTRPVHATT